MPIHKIFAFIVCLSLSSFCISQTIKGRITDSETGEALPGATIKVKGTQIATASVTDGYFTLIVSKFPLTLQINYLGYQSFEVKLNAEPGTTLKISLKEKQIDVSEVEVKIKSESVKKKKSRRLPLNLWEVQADKRGCCQYFL
jgi:hypothetical protein